MDVEVKMPDLSTNGGELVVLKWLVNEGDTIRRGQALFEVETDKATMEVESTKTGILKKKLIQPEQAVVAGDTIAIIELKQAKSTTGK